MSNSESSRDPGSKIAAGLICLIAGLSASGVVKSELLELSLEELLNLEVSSVSRRMQSLSSAPAAIHVLTAQDILTSGATSIPDALRMVPGLQVSQIDANKWSISARGFNSRFSNKMLVLIDGRSVYTPSFGGVYWELQHMVLADVERIEVIRGPGATMWGSNAVNGVINIITKTAADTQGGKAVVTLGSEENSAEVRYGGKAGDDLAYRVWATHRSYQESELLAGGDAHDGWNMSQAGLRVDGKIDESNSWTFKAEIYSQEADQVFYGAYDPFTILGVNTDDIEQSGYHLQGSWVRSNQDGSAFTLQSYLSSSSREEIIQDEERMTLDLDFHYQFAPMGNHHLMIGGGYRNSDHETTPTSVLYFQPEDEDFVLSNFFVQDEISLADDSMRLTLGVKAEKNDYTDVEYQPSVRFSWDINPYHNFWAAASKDVSLPSRVEAEGTVSIAFPPNAIVPVPILLSVAANPNVESEELKSFEMGLRSRLSKDTSLDVSLYHNDYEDIILAEPAMMPYLNFVCPAGLTCPPVPYIPLYMIPLRFVNVAASSGKHDTMDGGELFLNHRFSDQYALKLGYTYTNSTFKSVAVPGAPLEPATLSRIAMHQATMEFNYHISEDMSLDVAYKYVDALENVDVDSYNMLNLSFHWQITPGMKLSLVGRNLTEAEHLEYRPEVFQVETTMVKRSFYASLNWEF